MTIIKKAFGSALKALKKSPTRMIIIGFAVVIFVGAFFLCLPIAQNDGNWLNFGDALFTATSATCVTGLIVVDTATQFNGFGQFVILLLIQIGGLGVMTGTTLIFILFGRRLSLSSNLAIQESLTNTSMSSTVKLIKRIITYTMLIELVGALILMCSFIPDYGAIGIWVSIFLSISSFCNAGFDILGKFEGEFSSLTAYAGNAAVLIPIMLLIVLGGIGFMVIANLVELPKKKRLMPHTKIVLIVTAVLIAVGWIIFAAAEWNNTLSNLSVGGKLVSSLFQSVTPRTAGFNTIDQSALTPISYLTTIILMFIGASPSSTGGGIKTTTFLLLFVIVFSTLRGTHDVNLGKSRVSELLVRKVITILVIALTIIIVAIGSIALIESGNEHVGIKDIVFECTSAFATVGLGVGITPHLSAWSHIILSFVMFIGRLGALTIGTGIIKSHFDKSSIKYSNTKIMVG